MHKILHAEDDIGFVDAERGRQGGSFYWR